MKKITMSIMSALILATTAIPAIESAYDVSIISTKTSAANFSISGYELDTYIANWQNKGVSYLKINYSPSSREKTAVKNVQHMLNYFGYSLEEDGVYGQKTYNTVKKYQKKMSLTIDGCCGNETFTSLTNEIRKSISLPYSFAFDWNAAYNYAKAYWNKANPNYSYYSGNNCANFVSQCLVAAGVPSTNEFCNGSYAFVNVGGLRDYFRKTYGITYTSSPSASEIQAGDVIYTNNGGHVMIVMYKSGQKIYASGNTNNRDCLNVGIGAISGVLKTSKLFG